MRLIVIFAAATFFFITCKKTDLQTDYTGLYTSNQYKITSLPKMYTKTGEVTSRTSVDTYLNSLPALNDYFFRNTDTVINPGKDSIQFFSADTAAIKVGYRWDKRVVKPQGNYLYLYPLDTTIYRGYSNTNPFDEAVSRIGIYRPYFKAVYYGNLYLIYSYEAAIVQWQYGKLLLPQMNYSLRHSDPNGTLYGVSRTNYNNLFDPSVVSVLQDRDTLLVQTFELILEKAR